MVQTILLIRILLQILRQARVVFLLICQFLIQILRQAQVVLLLICLFLAQILRLARVVLLLICQFFDNSEASTSRAPLNSNQIFVTNSEPNDASQNLPYFHDDLGKIFSQFIKDKDNFMSNWESNMILQLKSFYFMKKYYLNQIEVLRSIIKKYFNICKIRQIKDDEIARIYKIKFFFLFYVTY